MKEYLKNNPEQIEKILNYYGYHSINITDKEIRCAKIERIVVTSVLSFIAFHGRSNYLLSKRSG